MMEVTDIFQSLTACLNQSSAARCGFDASSGLALLAALAGLLLCIYAARRLLVTVMTLRAVALMPALSRKLSNWVKSSDYTEAEFLRADGAPETWAEIRQKALQRLSQLLNSQQAQSIAWANSIRESFSDLRFTDANRVPFPFVRVMREKFNLCSVVTASRGPRLQNLDGHWTIDVSGSYGVNVAGFDRYKEWIQRGWDRVKDLGPVLGPLHPIVADNIASLEANLGRGRSVVSHERHRSGDGRGAHGAFQYQAKTDRLFLRRLSRLVGRRATGPWAASGRSTIVSR